MGKRGRPPKPRATTLKQALKTRRIFEKELASMENPSRQLVTERAAARLGVSTKTVGRYLNMLKDEDDLAELAELLLSHVKVIDGGTF